MASIYKPVGRRKYRIAYIDGRGRRKVAPGFRDKSATETKARQLERDAERERAGLSVISPQERNRPFEQAVDAYLADLRRQGTGEKHEVNAGGSLKRMAKWCNWKTLADIRVDKLTAYLAYLQSKNRGPRTLNSYRDYLAHFIDWCILQRWLPENPVRSVPKSTVGEKGRKRRRRAYTPLELTRLLSVAGCRKTIYSVAAFSGLRRSELLRIEGRDMDLSETRPRWTLRAEVSKNQTSAVIPMLPECAEVLRDLGPIPPTVKVFGEVPQIKTLHRDLAKASIKRLNDEGRTLDFHSLRYFFCTALARTLPIQKVRVLMRHKTLRQTCDLYLDLGLEDVAEEVWSLPRILTPKQKLKQPAKSTRMSLAAHFRAPAGAPIQPSISVS